MAMHPLPSELVFSTGQNQPEGVQNRKISPDGDHASALIFGGPVRRPSFIEQERAFSKS